MRLYIPSFMRRGERALAERVNAELAKIASGFDETRAAIAALVSGAGLPNYTWTAYADSEDGTANFTTGEPGGRGYLGLAHNRFTEVESTQPSDYAWSRIRGNDAPDGPAQDADAIGGRPASEVLAEIDYSTSKLVDAFVSLDAMGTLVDLRTLIGGEPVTAILLEETQTRQTQTSALASDLSLLGAKSQDGNAWVLNMAGVQTGNGQTIGTVLTQLGSVTAEHDQQIDLIFSNVVNGSGAESKAVLRVNQDGAIAGLTLASNGQSSSVTFLTDAFKIIDPNGGNPITPFSYSNGVLRMTNVEVDTLKYSALVPLLGGENNQLDPTGGYQILPGGFIIQWGQYRATMNNESSVAISFPMEFPNGCMAVTGTPYIAFPSNLRDLWIQVLGAPTKTQAQFYTQAGTDNSQALNGFDWMAFGY